jgi:hypothetical protein
VPDDVKIERSELLLAHGTLHVEVGSGVGVGVGVGAARGLADAYPEEKE